MGQLFQHQRQLIVKQKKSNVATNIGEGEKTPSAVGDAEIDAVDSATMADVDLQIAVHQADLLSLKHKYQVLDLKVGSLFFKPTKVLVFSGLENSRFAAHVVCHEHFFVDGEMGLKLSFKTY